MSQPHNNFSETLLREFLASKDSGSSTPSVVGSAQKAVKMSQRAVSSLERQLNDAMVRERNTPQTPVTEFRKVVAARKRVERDLAAAQVEVRQAEVGVKNAELEAKDEELASILAATIEVDDHFDLEVFRRTAEHPPFEFEYLRQPLPTPDPIPDPLPPTREVVTKVPGFFGKKKRLAKAQAEAEQRYAFAYQQWQAKLAEMPSIRTRQMADHVAENTSRALQLKKEQAAYDEACERRENDVKQWNEQLDALLAELGYGTEKAVETYFSLVFANSKYPSWFPVTHKTKFLPSTAELDVLVEIPGPAELSDVKTYRYVRTKDEVAETKLSQKALRDRYSNVIHQVALRTLHEVFEADRRGIVSAISLELGTNTVDPATGRKTYVPFVAVASSRSTFEGINLKAVTPAATLEYLGASVSKNPQDLVAASTAGIRNT